MATTRQSELVILKKVLRPIQTVIRTMHTMGLLVNLKIG